MNTLGDAVLTQVAKARQPNIDRRGLRIVTLAWAGLSAVQFVIWAIICVATLHVDGPWWMWSFAIPGALLAGAWWLTSPNRPGQQAG